VDQTYTYDSYVMITITNKIPFLSYYIRYFVIKVHSYNEVHLLVSLKKITLPLRRWVRIIQILRVVSMYICAPTSYSTSVEILMIVLNGL